MPNTLKESRLEKLEATVKTQDERLRRLEADQESSVALGNKLANENNRNSLL